ncbi:hypothetical protein [Hyphomicrobium sp. MC1]|uniref:hypothetical protein n=1 Tax=Hyphomicrobium sp. (strain MC1) TaxID=717785 RepID=UPI000213F796|nr:hypothetical protein [Hyphomicrobium sp. MC1]CCB63747.1 conserved protein of unknown function [Hyphomicrobium sp. MC1]
MDVFEQVPGPRGSELETLAKTRKQPQRYRWFDQWLAARPGPLRALVDTTVDFVQHHEEHTGKRKRARRRKDHEQHLQRLEAIICNLAYAVLSPPLGGRIAVSLGHGNCGRTRYDCPVMGKLFSSTLDLLWSLDFLDVQSPSVVRGEVSSIAVSSWFASKVAEAHVSLADFDRRQDEEIVILSRSNRSLRGKDGSVRKDRIDYAETKDTQRHRTNLRQLNAYLAAAAIDFLDDGLEPNVDPFERTMRRRFLIFSNQAQRFDQGGRLFGGFWQNLKSDRRKNIRIDGEATVVLDFSSMFTRLAYAHLGEKPPAGDLYSIPGFEDYRSGIKFAMNCFLFDGGARKSWPTELRVGVGNDANDGDDGRTGNALQAHLPFGSTVALVKQAILSVHPALKSAWDRRLGYKLMFQESEIMMEVLSRLAARNIPALCLHDGLIVAAPAAQISSEVMSSIAREHTGYDFPVCEKP